MSTKILFPLCLFFFPALKCNELCGGCLGISCLNAQPQRHVLQEEDEDEDNPDDLLLKEDEMPLSDDSDDDENNEIDDDQ